MSNKEKISYLEETLKRWPIIILLGSILYFNISHFYELENKVDKVYFIVDTDKRVNDNRVESIEKKQELQDKTIIEINNRVYALMGKVNLKRK